MSKRTATRLGWMLWLLAVLIALVLLAFEFLNDRSTFVNGVFGGLVNLAFVSVGALIVFRRRENWIGWIFLLGMLILETGELALEYAVYGLVTAPGSLAGAGWAAFLGDVMRTIGFYVLTSYVFLLFPDGRVPSARWRAAAWLPVLGILAYTIAEVFLPFPNDQRLQAVPNPIGISVSQDVYGLLSLVGLIIPVTGVILGAVAAVSRFRRSTGDEREQFKWFAYAVVVGTCLLFGLIVAAVMNVNFSYALGAFLFTLVLAGIPATTGIAILKYRLYDIDLIIRDTLIYSVLTALLALAYFVGVIVLQEILRTLTGQGSEIAVILSTLGIAALFAPLRRRIQDAVDRRFYRRRYDAQKILSRFGVTVRDEVELDQLTGALLAVVDETLQPASVSLWLKPAVQKRGQ